MEDASAASTDGDGAEPLRLFRKIPSERLELYLMRGFLEPDECAALIHLIDRGSRRSTIYSVEQRPLFRTSDSCDFDLLHPLVAEVDRRIARATGIAPEYGEVLQGQRYRPGQEFKAHCDFFATNAPYWEKELQEGGQRTWSALIFLNTPDKGGHTLFPKARLRITPVAGNLLFWNNLQNSGAGNPYSLHAGCPVAAGSKYVITKWFRERPRHSATATPR
jgi:prolyl 4-hydroxylase